MPKNIPAEIASLKRKLAKLEAQRLEELRRKRSTALEVVSDLDAQIAAITGRGAALPGRRKRTSPAEMRTKIFAAVSKSPGGLTQKQIADETQLPYGSVVAFLKKHHKEFRVTGQRKQKRYFSK